MWVAESDFHTCPAVAHAIRTAWTANISLLR